MGNPNMGLGTMGGMGASRVASGVTGLLIGLTGDPRPDDESVGVEDMPSAIALHATRQPRNRRNIVRMSRGDDDDGYASAERKTI